jgi:hypothetical protein
MAKCSSDSHGGTTADSKDVNQFQSKFLVTRGIQFTKRFAQHTVARIRFHGNEFTEMVWFEDGFPSLRVGSLGS